MNHFLTVFVAILAFTLGIGEILLLATKHALRRWGRALKLTSPLIVGYSAIFASIDPTTPLSTPDGVWVAIISVGTLIGLWRMDTDSDPWIKPTE
jgi:hypothetical protein